MDCLTTLQAPNGIADSACGTAELDIVSLGSNEEAQPTDQERNWQAPDIAPSQNHEREHMSNMERWGSWVNTSVYTNPLFRENLVQQITLPVILKSAVHF